MASRFATVKYGVAGRIARITLNRPARLNAIDERMPSEIRRALESANANERVHAIVRAGCVALSASAATSSASPKATPGGARPSRCRGTRCAPAAS